jgi:hypothetical protein
MTEDTPAHFDEEKPLDPAAESVRRKLLRFMFINLGILFAALMAVMIALVYKSVSADPAAEVTQVPPSAEMLSGSILLPPNSEILSHSLNGNRITLHLRRAAGGQMIMVYDMAERRVIGNFELGWQAE